jgi:sulfite reductase (NADPH) flavoprotein alpha-component
MATKMNHARNKLDLRRGDSVLILYATATGNAESLANKLAAILTGSGGAAQVRDMARCQPNVLTQAKRVLLVISTYGDGEPPEDAAPFWEAVVRGNGIDLRGVGFSVLALGNRTFDQFCKCGRDFDAALERHGARRIYPRVDCDVDYDLPAAAWMNGVIETLRETWAAVSAPDRGPGNGALPANAGHLNRAPQSVSNHSQARSCDRNRSRASSRPQAALGIGDNA